MSQVKATAAGTLDPNFGAEGIVSQPFKDVAGLATAVLPLAQNKLLLVLNLTKSDASAAKVAKLLEDGSLDMSFGQNGIVEIPFTDDTWFSPSRLRPAANGGWLITGTAEHPVRGVELAVVRQLQDGRLDNTFGKNKDGKVLINIAELLGLRPGDDAKLLTRRHDRNLDENKTDSAESGGVSVTDQADGKILLVTTIQYAFDNLRGLVIRLNPDGSLDETFNGKGVVQVELPDINHRWNYASGVAVQEDGKVLVSGDFSRESSHESPDAYVIRYHQNGEIDRQYGDSKNGVVTITDTSRWLVLGSITLKPDGGIIATGSAEDDFRRAGLIVALNPTGSFNIVFNNGRPLLTNLLEQGESWRRSALQKDASGNVLAIIVSGQGSSSLMDERNSLVTARYLLNGSLDKAFGGGGWVEFNDDSAIDLFRDSAVTADNNIVVCGFVSFGPLPPRGNVLRYLG
ncbi:delta-60 repeat domain-containing protein [Pseudomonas nunensis]|uniref:Delta-60 repeat domain-containing protein n=1 Tax=Pseudomonas nunensis TaxID=2961896 RepID=A0ABY5EIA1_9PSED|nr:delta-60 repeat domain-containing protein [Pseudomonas nunensis]KPN88332.1 hypothetical protein AL066_29315 [Pseudomonas nunensis]MCL5226023.1 delta-60 repeat domain-containing protein [Pseudomonas nunensis]UTO14002.1 delta-60 repeat domain-containing protein [Pseudomonas nunensis]